MSSTEDRLHQLCHKHDGLTPQIVVEDATNPLSPLHAHFCWDDKQAGELYRLEQARFLIRRFKITVERKDKEPVEVRTFQFIPSTSRYLPTDHVMRNQELRAEVLQRAASELRAFRKKYQALIDVQQLATEIFELLPAS